MVLPLILGIVGAVDLAVFFLTGKDILEHATGWDPVGDVVDWAFDSFLGSSDGTGSDFREYMDEWGNTILERQDEWGMALSGQISGVYDMTVMILLGIALVAVVVIIRTKPGRFK